MGPERAHELLRSGRDALAAADWERARSCFEQARELQETPEVLDCLSQAAHFAGEYERAIELKERAFAAYRRDGERVEASHIARWLAFLHGTFHGNWSVASGWLGRAEGLLEDVEECAAHGWLILDRAPFSRTGHGAVGEIYCRLLSACEHAGDVRCAEEWLAGVDRLVVWERFVRPTCKTHYGGILIALGRWREAEAELLEAMRAFERSYRGDRVFPLVRLADLRVRQGRYEEAERLIEGVEWHPTARRAAAAIALARGDLGLAQELVRLCLEGGDPADVTCAPSLELLVEIQLADEDLAAATDTLERLAVLAADSHDARVGAFAQLAAGSVAVARKDERAPAHLKDAVERFAGLDLPLEAARAQLQLAHALHQRRPKPRRPRRGWRSRRSSGSAQPVTPTRRPVCSAGSGRPDAPSRGATGN